jgi:ABC-type lipoprotein export system ATPase subunit
MRKNLISMSSPSPSSNRLAEGKPIVEIAQFAREDFRHEDCKYLLQNYAAMEKLTWTANSDTFDRYI